MMLGSANHDSTLTDMSSSDSSVHLGATEKTAETVRVSLRQKSKARVKNSFFVYRLFFFAVKSTLFDTGESPRSYSTI